MYVFGSGGVGGLVVIGFEFYQSGRNRSSVGRVFVNGPRWFGWGLGKWRSGGLGVVD